MNIGWRRLIDGMIESLRDNVLPALDDAYARAQVYGLITALTQVRVGADWLRQPLREQVEAQRALFAKVDALAAKHIVNVPITPPQLLQGQAGDEQLWDLRDAGDRYACQLIRAMGEHGEGQAEETVQELQALLQQYMQGQLAIEVRYLVKPEFSQVTSGST